MPMRHSGISPVHANRGGLSDCKACAVQSHEASLTLGVIGTILGTLGVVASWGSKLGPAWYPIALAVLAIPQSWIGARFYPMRKTD